MPRITDFCSCIYVLGCKLSFVRLCDSDFGITAVDDITVGIICAVFCFHIAHISFASSWYLFCLSVIVLARLRYYYFIYDYYFIYFIIIIITIIIIIIIGGSGSSVGGATDYGLDGPGSNPVGTRFSACPDRPCGPPQPPVKWVPGLSRG